MNSENSCGKRCPKKSSRNNLTKRGTCRTNSKRRSKIREEPPSTTAAEGAEETMKGLIEEAERIEEEGEEGIGPEAAEEAEVAVIIMEKTMTPKGLDLEKAVDHLLLLSKQKEKSSLIIILL